MLGIPLSAPGGDLSKWFIPTYVGHTALAGWLHRPWRFIPTYVGHTSCPAPVCCRFAVHPHIRGAYPGGNHAFLRAFGSSPHTWGILNPFRRILAAHRFIPTYVGHTQAMPGLFCWMPVHPHIRGAYYRLRVEGDYFRRFIPTYVGHTLVTLSRLELYSGSSPHTWGIHWTAVRKMAGFSHFSYDFTRKSYFVQGLVFFGVIGAEASPTHRRGRNQCLPGAHGGSVRNL